MRRKPPESQPGFRAGDALFSAFIHFYAKGLKPIDCLKRAEVFAAYKIGFDGASVGFTDEETVEKLTKKSCF